MQRMTSSKRTYLFCCRRKIITVCLIVLAMQLLNSLSYVYLMDRSTKVVGCQGYSHLYEDDSPVNKTVLDDISYFQLQINRKTALIYGHFRQNKSYLTIGIPTVQRRGINYLDQTLNSLIENTLPQDRQEIVLAVFLADHNQTWIRSTADRLMEKYLENIHSGFLQIFHYHEQIYPDFNHLPRTFNDSLKRVAWRSKQNIDYAFMFMYCKNMSHYYMQLEDDVLASPGYFASMKFFIANSNLQQEWYSLEFSSLGFLGKLFRNRDLQELANFLLMFYWEQPGDLLFGYIKQIKTQFTDIKMKPPLFQHKGVVSSLAGKRQFLLENRSFSRKRFYNLNPAAYIETNIETFEDHAPEKAYDMSDEYFWGMSPKAGDNLTVYFQNPVNISSIYIGFGLPQRQNDVLKYGIVMVSSTRCNKWTFIGMINKNKTFDTNGTNVEIPNNVACLLVNVTKSQNNWVIIREISIFREGDIIVENPFYSMRNKIQNSAMDYRSRMQVNPLYANQIQEQIEKIRQKSLVQARMFLKRQQRMPIENDRMIMKSKFFQNQFLSNKKRMQGDSNAHMQGDFPPPKNVFRRRFKKMHY